MTTDRLAEVLHEVGINCTADRDGDCDMGLHEDDAARLIDAGVTLDPRPHVADIECAICGEHSVGTFPLCGIHARYGGVDLVPLDSDRWYDVLRPAPDALREAFLAGVRRGTSDGMESYPEVADDYAAARTTPPDALREAAQAVIRGWETHGWAADLDGDVDALRAALEAERKL